MKQKPGVLKDYFKWRHNPSKGDSIMPSEFGSEVSSWWSALQPRWRYKGEDANSQRDYSYILAGGKKGVFLIILCLAWWNRAHGRELEREKAERRETARAAGKDDTTLDFSDLSDHEITWYNTVNDVINVLELAQAWPVPGEGVLHAVEGTPTRRKRAVEGDNASSRKKKKTS
jgi:hypothetical protein